MNNFLQFAGLLFCLFAFAGALTWVTFFILNRDPLGGLPMAPPFPDEPGKPVAWRIRRGNRYYYMDKSEPFPVEDAEPLYLGKKQ